MSFLGRWLHSDREAHYRRAIDLYNERQFEGAIAEFRKLTEGKSDRDPRVSLARFYVAEAHSELGWTAIESGDLEQARDQFLAALESGYRYPDLLLRLGRVHEALGEHIRAEAAYGSALAIHEGLLEARAHRASLRLRHGLPLGDDLDRLAAVGWSLAPGWQGLTSPEACGNPALDALRDAVFHALEDELAERERVADQIRAALEAFDTVGGETALALLETAVSLRPEYPDLHFRIGVIHARAGRRPDAERALSAALELNPDYEEAQRWLDRVRSAKAA